MQLLIITTILTALAQAAMEVHVYNDGDTSCSNGPVKFTRLSASGQCNAVSCFATSQGKNLAATLSSKTICLESMAAPAPAPASNNKRPNYAVQVTFSGSSTCETGKETQMEGLVADGGCHLIGNSYSKASCTAGGKVQSWTCPDSSCSSASCVMVFDGTDGVCASSLMFKCLQPAKLDDSDVSAADVFGAPSIVATSALMLAMAFN